LSLDPQSSGSGLSMSDHERGDQTPAPADPKAGESVLSSDRWQRIKDLFTDVQEHQPTDRTAYLTAACGGDEALLKEIESLLAAAAGEEAMANTAKSPVKDPLVGRRIGAYKVERQIGSGGMASVYLACRADEEYQKQVAVKILRPELDSGELLRRFRIERQTLATLDHPNIVKLLDGGSTEDGLPFIVMDYVDGTPIDAYCDSHALSIEDRLRLFREVCAGVECAHQNFVIHRDLKPSNILVTADGTPKLLDFGIAKVLSPPDSDQPQAITQTLARRMTPAYASPEQIKGNAVTTATDIYSLGVVLYELLTGHRPYKLKQSTPAELERAICEEEPENPSTAVDRVESTTTSDGTTVTKTPDLVSRARESQPEKLRRRLRGDLDNIVLMALQKEASRRYGSVGALSEDIHRHLDHLPVRARPSTWAYRSTKFVNRHRTGVLTGALLVLVALGGAVFVRWEEKRAAEKARAEAGGEHMPGRRSAAVLGFKNLSARPDTSWVSTALSEMLTTELAAGGQLRTAPGESVAQMKINLVLPETDALSRETLRRVRRNLNCDYVVLGSYLDQGEGIGGQVRLDMRLQDAVTGETLAAVADNGTEANLSDLVSRAGATLRSKLGAGEVSPSEWARIKASLPSSPDAARFYAEGLAKLRLFDVVGGRDLLQKAIAAAPDFAMAHSALADAWRTMGHDAEAKVEAKAAFDLAENLPREQALLIEGSYWHVAREWDKSIEIYRTLFNFFPDNLEYGLRLAAVQTAAGKGQDALAALESLRKLPPPEGSDATIDLAESLAANSISDYKREASAASVAAKKAKVIGARLVVARARLLEARALMELGEPAKALPLLAEAKDIYTAAGDQFALARVLQNIGLAYFYQSNFDQAKKTYEEALTIQQGLGNRANQAKLLNGIGLVLERKNDLDGAKRAYQQTLDICREIDDRAMIGTAVGNVGSVEAQQGDFRNAQKHFQEALNVARQVGELSAVGLQLGNLAQIMVLEGNSSAAKPFLEESIQISRSTGKKYDLGTALIQLGDLHLKLGELAAAQDSYAEARQMYTAAGNQADASAALSSIGHVQAARGNLADARHSFEEALVSGQRLGNMRAIQDTLMALSDLALEEGRFSDAEAEARQALEGLRAGKDRKNEAVAEALLADALLAQKKLQEAQTLASQAQKLAAEGSDSDSQIYVALVDAKIRAASGKFSDATKLLKQIISDARKSALLARELEARFFLGETEVEEGDLAAGDAELRALQREANAKGFALIARKAAAARKKKLATSRVADSR
jgi:serine/threonine protein kinase/tetratricopeptide (TPR) repeat protein